MAGNLSDYLQSADSLGIHISISYLFSPPIKDATSIIQDQQLRHGIHASKIGLDLQNEAVLCWKLLAGTGLTLRQAVELGLRHRPKAADKIVSEVLKEFLINRQTIRNNRTRTIDEYRCQLGKFNDDFGHRLIDDISATEIEKWLAAPHLDNKGRRRTWAGSRRNVTRGYIATLFTFGLNKKWCISNPAKGVDKAIVERSPIEVWTPVETALILKTAADDCPEVLNFLVLSLFSGLRTCELHLLLAEHVKLDQEIIKVPAHISKTRKLRNIPFSKNLLAGLTKTKIHTDSGRIWGLGESSLHRRYRLIEKGTGLKWRGNALRHTFASHHLAHHDNEYLTSRVCGHTPRMLREHYDAAVSKIHGQEHFNIFPQGIGPSAFITSREESSKPVWISSSS